MKYVAISTYWEKHRA